MVYHGKLGTQGERVERVRRIAKDIGQLLGGPELAAQADRAAFLAKADLLTDMVGEFPELQGVMGGYYARFDGEDEAVAQAIEDHYKPRFAGDELPRNLVGVAVALADKLETLVGLFGIGQVPTGDKDPFALRRHALGVVRMLTECPVELSQRTALERAVSGFPDHLIHKNPAGDGTPLWQVIDGFMNERAVGHLVAQGHSESNIDAVMQLCSMSPDFIKRLQAVRVFAELPEAPTLAAANKRVGNILKKSEGLGSTSTIDIGLFQEAAETALHSALLKVGPTADAAFHKGDYTVSLLTLAALKAPIDAFFDSVMVNAEDPSIRNNRLALLRELHAAMNRVADLSKLAS